MEQTTKPTLLTARLIAGSLIAGVLIFWVIALVMGGRAGAGGAADQPPDLWFWIWAVAALAGLAGALAFRGRALQVVEESRSSGGAAPPAESLARVQTNLIVAWALVEFPALLAGAFVYLSGAAGILLAAAPVFAIGMALTFPRAEWFGAHEMSR